MKYALKTQSYLMYVRTYTKCPNCNSPVVGQYCTNEDCVWNSTPLK